MMDETRSILRAPVEEDVSSSDTSSSTSASKPTTPTTSIKKIVFAILKEWLFFGIIIAIVAAYLFPKVGSKDGPLHVDVLNMVLIAAVFFCIGLSMDSIQLRNSALNWKSHLMLQLTIFVVTPLIFFAFAKIFEKISGALFPSAMAVGFIITGSLPTTFDTCVIFTRSANGDEATAMINGTLSNLIGILLTPLLIYIQLRNSIGIGAIASTLIKLTEICLAPFVAGQLIRLVLLWRNVLSEKVMKALSHLRIVPKIVLIWLTFTSFCTTFESQLLAIGGAVIGLSLSLLTIIHIIMLGFVSFYIFLYHKVGGNFTRAMVAAHIFVGTEKTMTLAIPVVSILYGNSKDLGVLLIPVIAYHSIETLVGGIILIPMKKWVKRDPSNREKTLKAIHMDL